MNPYAKGVNASPAPSVTADNTSVSSPLTTQCEQEEPLSPEARFSRIISRMFATYKAKNSDYGDSFKQTIADFGPIAGLIPISHKYHRLKTLMKSGKTPLVNETLGDTLMDMANYCIMLKMALEQP